MPGTSHEEMISEYGEAEYERAFTVMRGTGWAVLPDQRVLTLTGSKYYAMPLDILTEWEGKP